jgi:two-component system, cell cycle sensor histidine kinase and response regulator CckA
MMAFLVTLLMTAGPPPERLTTVAAVRALDREQAARKHPVEVTATVTQVNAAERVFFVQDTTGAVFVNPTPLAAGLAAGDRVVLTGVTDPGTFAPSVLATGVRQVGRGPLPRPELHSLDPDDNLWLDACYVEARVVVQAHTTVGPYHRFRVATAKGRADVHAEITRGDTGAAERYVGAAVRVRGVCGSPKHDPKSGTAAPLARLFVAGLDALEVLPDTPGSPAPVPIANVQRGFTPGPNPFGRPVTVRGVVTLAVGQNGEPWVAVQDESGAARVAAGLPAGVRRNDTVEATGFRSPSSPELVLINAVVRPAAPPLPVPQPVATTADQLVRGDRWVRLVRVEGEVRSVTFHEGERLVTCTDAGRQFVVAYSGPADSSALGGLEPGSRVAAVGPAVPISTAGEASAFRIVVADPGDVTVVSSPPPPGWWTGRRVVQLLVGVAALAVVVGAWIVVLRHQVRRQAAAIRAHYDRQTDLEKALNEARRLESLGRLVGGIAHDFNNLLSVVIGGGNLAAEMLPEGSPARDLLRSIVLSGERGADLTRQLLQFSRGTAAEKETVCLNAALREVEGLVRSAAGDGVALTAHYADPLPKVLADRGLIAQVVLNLATNARDAMAGHGRLTIRTEAEAGRGRPRVRWTVSDTGCGMDEATRARVFEPFFTTKAVGKGTGLGLATVYGIVQELGGTIGVESAVGRGTTFTIEFPAAAGAPDPPPVVAPEVPRPAVTIGPILVIDDEPAVRRVTVAVLRRYGLPVAEAESPEEALELVRSAGEPFAVMITDVVMPEMSGPELAARVRAVCPAIRVLFISGYTRDEMPDVGSLPAGDRFLKKPFGPLLLLAELQDMAAGSRHGGEAAAPG